MRIELTLRHEGREHDIAITSAGPVPLRETRAELCRATGLPTDTPLWSGSQLLASTAGLGSDGLRNGAVVGAGGPDRAAPQPGALALHQVGGPGAGRVVPLGRGRLVIGRGVECDLVLPDADVSRRHAVVEIGADGVAIHDLGSTNGTSVDGDTVAATLPRGRTVAPGQLIRMGDCCLVLTGPTHVPAATSSADDGTLRLLRPPRRSAEPTDRVIELPIRPDHQRPRAVQWVAALLPAVAGVALAWFAHSPQFLLFALLSPLMMLSTSLGDRLHWRRSRRRDSATYGRRAAEAAREVAAGLRAETLARRAIAPDPADVLRLAVLPSSRLWERRRTDPDFLSVRLGITEQPSSLRVREGNSERPAGTVPAVPLGASLRDGPLGLAVPSDVRAGVGRWLIGQLCCLHSPADAGVCLMLADDVAAGWTWARWLPHLQGRVAVGREQCAALVADLAELVNARLADHRVGPHGWAGPWLVVVIYGAAALSDVAGLTALLDRCTAAGVTAICFDTDPAALPTGCRTVARSSGETGTRALLHDRTHASDTELVLDRVGAEWADTVARRLAPLVDVGSDASTALPTTCGLLDCAGIPAPATGIDPESLAQRWPRSAGGAHATIGVGADGPLQLDLLADGPHALIAGTTGAGKSELLQSIVVGLATEQSPDDLAMLLVDYKGGAAFADCARLPHTAGLVTDLDAHLTTRALRSLHSELRRRERLLAGAAVADLVDYRAAGSPAGPLPRLVIVVDEFASLVEELPDFVRGLIGVAQRGRSLGVHLILATQRPSSAVSPEIRANTSLRIALRVTDAADSTDVIDAPDAAAIERGTPGRGYLRRGGSLTCFQTAYGATPVRSATGVEVRPLGPWRQRTAEPGPDAGRTELSDLVDAIEKAASTHGFAVAESPWLPPLPDELPLTALPAAGPGEITIGVVDCPDEQRREPFTLDLRRGAALVVAGAARSGRTGVLAAVALAAAQQYGPHELSIHVVAAAGALAAQVNPLPHCASMLGPDDGALVPTLLRRVAAQAAQGDATSPRSVILIDGWDAVCAGLGDFEAAECADLLAAAIRPAGVTVVVAGDRSVLAPRFAANFGTRLVLRMADRNDFSMVGVMGRDVPDRLPAGRGLRGADGALVQIAHPGDRPAPEVTERAAAVVADSWQRVASRPHPATFRLRALPRSVALAALVARTPQPAGTILGLGGDDGRVLSIQLMRGSRRMLVAGPPRSGRTTTLRTLLSQARLDETAVVVAAPPRSALHADARALGITVLEPHLDAAATASLPDRHTLLLVDDVEAFADCPVAEVLTDWVRRPDLPIGAVVAGRADDLATSYRGLAAQVRRANTGVLLRPGPVDGEILGVRLPRRQPSGPPGRGVIVGDPAWGPDFAGAEPLPIQVAHP